MLRDAPRALLVLAALAASALPLVSAGLPFAAAGWTVSGVEATWAYGPGLAGPAAAAPVLATNPAGDHAVGECSAVTSAPFAAAAVMGPGPLHVRFTHYFRASAGAAGVVQASRDDGASWITLVPFGGYPGVAGAAAAACLGLEPGTGGAFTGDATGPAFALHAAGLEAFASDVVRVRFAFASGDWGSDHGWHLRSVSVTRGAAPIPLLVG